MSPTDDLHRSCVQKNVSSSIFAAIFKTGRVHLLNWCAAKDYNKKALGRADFFRYTFKIGHRQEINWTDLLSAYVSSPLAFEVETKVSVSYEGMA